MSVTSLGYVIVESSDMARWRRFAVDTLGLAEGSPDADGALRLKVDERPFRILVVPGQVDRFVAAGWEFRDQASFDAVVAQLREAGVSVREGDASEAARRCVGALAVCADPCGNQVELFRGRAYDYQPFSSPRGLSGFVTGDQGMGHVVLPAPKLAALRDFYKRYLGFGDSDEMWLQMSPNPTDPRLGIHFLHAGNPRHHSLALVGAPVPSGCVHIMLQARSLDDVGYALDRCIAAGDHISSTLGKHSNDDMVSFYVQLQEDSTSSSAVAGSSRTGPRGYPRPSLVRRPVGPRWSPPPAN